MKTKTEIHILFAWIGNSDREAAGILQNKRLDAVSSDQLKQAPDVAAKATKEENLGPILRTILQDTVTYQKVVLLGDRPEQDSSYIDWLKNQLDPGSEQMAIILAPYSGNAMDRQATYAASRSAIETYATDNGSCLYRRSYLLSGGTPAMHTNLVLLAYDQTYQGRMIDASVKEGVKEVPRWVEIRHFLPQPPLNTEEYLSSLYEEAISNSDTAKNMIGVRDAISLAADAALAPLNDYSILIQGPTGTGKELIAKIISELVHKYNSFKGSHNIQPINCGAIPSELLESELFGYEKGAHSSAGDMKQGLIELAQNGVLFLDEIGDMPLSLQVKLLRVLNDRKLRRLGGTNIIELKNVRVISATHRDLHSMIEKGEFREDLYYRLSIIPILLPPLRDRQEDIEPLAEYIIKKINEDFGRSPIHPDSGLKPVKLGDGYLEALYEYDWPGNIRELEGVLKRAAVVVNRTRDQIISKDVLRRLLPVRKFNPLGGANVQDIINTDKSAADFLDEIQYHCYQKLLDYQRSNPQNREWLAKKMGISENTLRSRESVWTNAGKATDSHCYKKNPNNVRHSKK